jgi:hypothetical protein
MKQMDELRARSVKPGDWSDFVGEFSSKVDYHWGWFMLSEALIRSKQQSKK